MVQTSCNLWDKWVEGNWILIPTNCQLNSNGEAVMGAGLALAAKSIIPGIQRVYGDSMNDDPFQILYDQKLLLFPSKYDWRKDSSIDLIEESITRLKDLSSNFRNENFYIPRIGCGLGKLKWQDISTKFEDLPDNIYVTTIPNNKVIIKLNDEMGSLSSNHKIYLDSANIEFPSVEHAWHACRSGSWEDRFAISKMNIDQLRSNLHNIKSKENWSLIEVNTLKKLLLMKFKQNNNAMEWLRSLKNNYLEYVGMNERWTSGKSGCGMNLLGYLHRSIVMEL